MLNFATLRLSLLHMLINNVLWGVFLECDNKVGAYIGVQYLNIKVFRGSISYCGELTHVVCDLSVKGVLEQLAVESAFKARLWQVPTTSFLPAKSLYWANLPNWALLVPWLQTLIFCT